MGVLDSAIKFAQSINGKTAGEAVGLTIDKTVGAIKTLGKNVNGAMNWNKPGFGATFSNAADRDRLKSFFINNQEAVKNGAYKNLQYTKNKKNVVDTVSGLDTLDRIGLTFASSSGKGGYDYGRIGMAAGGVAGAGFLIS